jgi:hypothetical protein
VLEFCLFVLLQLLWRCGGVYSPVPTRLMCVIADVHVRDPAHA